MPLSHSAPQAPTDLHLRRTAGRRRLLGLGTAALALWALGCSGSLVTRVDDVPPAPPDQGWLQLKVDPPTAEVHVDGRFFGNADGYREGLLRLPRGLHRIELRAAGRYAWYRQVVIDAQPVTLEVQLLPEPAAGR